MYIGHIQITFSKTEGMQHRTCHNSMSPEWSQIVVFVRMINL